MEGSCSDLSRVEAFLNFDIRLKVSARGKFKGRLAFGKTHMACGLVVAKGRYTAPDFFSSAYL